MFPKVRELPPSPARRRNDFREIHHHRRIRPLPETTSASSPTTLFSPLAERQNRRSFVVPNLDFYATEDDLDPIFAFILAEGCEIFESYSIPERELRRYETTDH